jgi:hypothetical protein
MHARRSVLARSGHCGGRACVQTYSVKEIAMPDQKLCFVIGPIGEKGSEPRIHADVLLNGIIESVVTELGFTVKSADQDPRLGSHKIFRNLHEGTPLHDRGSGRQRQDGVAERPPPI